MKAKQDLKSQKISDLYVTEQKNNIVEWMEIVLKKDSEIMKWDSRLKDQLVYTVKEKCGPIKEALKYKGDIGAISNILQSTYLNGTEGLATLLDLETMRKKQPLDFVSSLSNIDYSLTNLKFW